MAWSSRGCFWGEYFSPNISDLCAFPTSFHLMYFHFSLRIFFIYRLVLEIWVISRTSRYNEKVMRYIFFALFHEVNIPVTVSALHPNL